ncbi:hypothetical protein K469DRAFT_517270, partial [Zopfia rhizophila CBS 207.26]
WRLEIKNGYHNHLPSLNPSTHHVYRKRTEVQKQSIETLSKAGNAPKRILTVIRQEDPYTLITAKDVYNDRIVIRSSYLMERTPTEALLDML